MRVIAIAMGILFLATTSALGQQPMSTQQAQQLRNGNRKIIIGLTMIAAGAFVAPWTASQPKNGSIRPACIATMFVGSGVAMWGAIERRRALQPQVAIGIGPGKAKIVRVTQTW